MTADWTTRLLFVFYCCLVGLMLTLLPWSPGWNRMVTGLPSILQVLAGPWPRGAIMGFGLVHLVWAAHDLFELFRLGIHGSDSETSRHQ
ncbi:MAG: hypothetical protein AAGD38_05210 [Acidobacteriota bacterium]